MSYRFTSVVAASLLGTTALVASANAQDAAQTEANVEACENLRTLNEENAELFNEEFVVGARRVVEQDDAAVCGPWLAEAERALQESEGADLTATGGRIVVTQPEPTVTVDQADPRVSVTQEDPTVSVQQAQPEIIVRQQQPTIRVEMPRPTITIDQPQPQIIVRMPDPKVNVTTPEPQVSVSQAQPKVSVEQGQPQIAVEEPTVDVEKQGSANINVQQGQPIVTQESGGTEAQVNIEESQPVVTYEQAEPKIEFSETGEPNIQYTQSGEPDIQVEKMDENGAAAQGATAAEGGAATQGAAAAEGGAATEGTAATGQAQEQDQFASLRAGDEPIEAGEPTTVVASEIIGRNVVNAADEDLGEVERLVFVDQRIYAVLAEGGFLGLGEREVALPLDAMSIRGDELLLRGMTEEDIEALPEFDTTNAPAYAADEEVEIGTL
ncbi:PRC-barrel domain-containing protein [Aurantimonas sp. HBX-1]|uniref:PRC-barrel domain-containing protein n=1 Tax=Aurantimonas sp. HBX-1 TaxID=2906072 RepID=UPI001F1FC966|nr:PRC-barrel domain-containing protein [Aurantimonas sp. HBX-1]UIJ73357.1 PRC-barrel domain-containing protein [Aurantimonas sp. HBX-1]